MAGTKSQTMGEVDESTVANEAPYATAKRSSSGNWVVKGIAPIMTQPATMPATIGFVLPILSEILPINGRTITNATISLPVMIPTERRSILTTSVKYPTKKKSTEPNTKYWIACTKLTPKTLVFLIMVSQPLNIFRGALPTIAGSVAKVRFSAKNNNAIIKAVTPAIPTAM